MANPPKKLGFVNARIASEMTGVHEKTLLKWARNNFVSCLKTGKKSIFFNTKVLQKELDDLYESGSKQKRSKKRITASE